MLLIIGIAVGLPVHKRTQLRGADVHPMASDQDPRTLAREFQMLRAAGASSVRFDVFWHALEWRARGVYDPAVVTHLDAVFAETRHAGFKVILDVWSSPCWASSAPQDVSHHCEWGWWSRGVNRYPPHDPADYARFVAFVARRWGANLAALELWNEPNGSFLHAPDQAATYARLVRATYAGVKSVRPHLPVIISLAGTDCGFLHALYRYGVAGHYDGIAVHPYGDASLSGLEQFHAYQLNNGDRRPLWVTEVGWPSSVVGTRTQADNVVGEFVKLAQLNYVAGVEIYEMRDAGTSNDPQDHFGLVDTMLRPKPAWRAFSVTLHWLGNDHQL